MKRDSRIYIAGHRGLVGSAIFRKLKAEGYNNLITRTHAELDLERQAEVEAFFDSEKPEYVFLAAAKVGGIWANSTYPAEFIYSNSVIQTNVIHAAWKVGVKRLLLLGSSCIYPRECPQPMKEEYLLTGPLEPTNQPYALAKIAGIIQCEAYNRQYGTHFLAVMPTNLYGPNDNFDLKTSHALPALIRKFHLAKLATHRDWDAIARDEKRFGPIPDDFRVALGLTPRTPNPKRKPPRVVLWGSGSPRREFLHVDDLANACLFLMNLDETTFTQLTLGAVPSASTLNRSAHQAQRSSIGSLPLINIGCGKDSTVRELATLVSRMVEYEGGIVWDDTKPDGTPRKLLESSRLKALGWSPRIDFEDGIQMVHSWYLRQLGCASKPN